MSVASIIQTLPLGRLFKFACVGLTGFGVDTGALIALHHGLGLDPFTARFLSIALAIFTTWRLNRSVTFGHSDTDQISEGARYYTVAILTASVNFGIYSSILLIWVQAWPVAAAIGASAFTMFVSFFGYSRLVFRAHRR